MSYLPRPKAFVLAYGVFALALLTYCLSTALSKPPGQDEDPEYPFVEGLAGIVTLYEAEQSNWLPLCPPGTLPWLQTANPGVLQFKTKDFPKEFTDNLIPIEQYGVYVYPIIVFEHPTTRDRVFYNANQEQIASVPAPPDYDPLWYLLQAYGQEYLDQLPPGKLQELIQTVDPSRLWSLFKLILPQDLATYIENKQIANLPGPGIEMTMGEGGESNLEFTAMNVTNGYVE
ncbi:MAG: hypothetical protein JXR37_17785, partial [Kiritimatiellae bacterium]|nr:hypothetical protein [Kiritimatiellia bacterium]